MQLSPGRKIIFSVIKGVYEQIIFLRKCIIEWFLEALAIGFNLCTVSLRCLSFYNRSSHRHDYFCLYSKPSRCKGNRLGMITMDAAITLSETLSILLNAPRTLNEPVFWRFLILKNLSSHHFTEWVGVQEWCLMDKVLIFSAAFCMSLNSTIWNSSSPIYERSWSRHIPFHLIYHKNSVNQWIWVRS